MNAQNITQVVESEVAKIGLPKPFIVEVEEFPAREHGEKDEYQIWVAMDPSIPGDVLSSGTFINWWYIPEDRAFTHVDKGTHPNTSDKASVQDFIKHSET